VVSQALALERRLGFAKESYYATLFRAPCGRRRCDAAARGRQRGAPGGLGQYPGQTHTAVYQTTGYGPHRGTGGPSWSGNNYAGSGIAAWSSPAYLEVAGWGPWGQGYPAGGYGWYTAAGYSYLGPGNAGYLAYPRGRNYGYGSGISPAGAWSPSTSADARGLYYVPGTGSYYAPLLPCRDADSC
jgi:hypothetical protein